MEDTEDKPTSALPAIFEHCCSVYKAMAARAETRTVDDAEVLVYEGALTKLFRDQLGLSVPYYTSSLGELKRMGCLAQLRRGGGGAPSIWALYFEPTPDIWRNTIHRTVRTKASKTAATDAKINDINSRLNKVEKTLHGLMEAMSGKETA